MASSDKILIGRKTKLKEIDKGIGEYFFEKAEKFGNNIFQINADTGEEQSFLQVLQRSIRVAIGLQKLGLKRKEIVMLCCWNDLDNIIPWFATIFLDGIVCSAAPELIQKDLDMVVATIQPIKVLFVVEEVLELLQQSLKLANSNPIIIIIGDSNNQYQKMSDMENLYSEEEKTFQPVKVDVNETALIVLSSGTTATPKGICLSQMRFMDWALNFENSGLTGAIIQKCSMYWVSAVFTTYQIVATGACKILSKLYTHLKYLEVLSKYKVQIALCADGSYYAVLEILKNLPVKMDFSNLLIFYVGGSVIEEELILKYREAFPPPTKVFNLYGSTETGSVTYFPPGDPKAYDKINSIGVVRENIELKFADIITGEPIGPNEEGEMCIKSPFLMQKYYDFENPDVYDKDGYFKSGDLGYYDEDGFVYITDRINETFKVRFQGRHYKICPSVVRQEILKHIHVENAVVFNIPHKEEINQIASMVVLKKSVTSTASEILEFANKELPDFRQIRGGLKIVKDLPITVTDKIMRRNFVKMFSKSCCCKSKKQ